MFVVKRNGKKEGVKFDKITERLERLARGLPELDATLVTKQVAQGVFPGVSTVQLDELASEIAAAMASDNPDYGVLAARLVVSNLHKETVGNFASVMRGMFANKTGRAGSRPPLVARKVLDFVDANAEALEDAIDYQRDFDFDYFGIKTLVRTYLSRVGDKVVERPQHMLMRVACGIHAGDLKAVVESYRLMSAGFFTHASPTLFNAGKPLPQLSSCFLLTMEADSIDGIYNTVKQCALISKNAGGVGLSVHKIRATGSYIAGSNGESRGLVPMLRVLNSTARYVDQGGRRKGAFAVYLEPWHADVFQFLELRKNTGKEEDRARDLFLALWVPDLFMARVQADGQWSLMCPAECPGLADVWGEAFEKLYVRYEQGGMARKTLRARELWTAIINAQIETGTPFILFKDACNARSNQQHLGTIRGSNLCTEIVQFTSPEEVAVCNLASLALPKYVTESGFDHKRLFEVTQVVVRNLDRVIDVNFYPVPEAEKSNLAHRPIGIGVQGLADVFQMLRLPFTSAAAKRLNKEIFETIYFAALTTSVELARTKGRYPSFEGSPLSKGVLQFDMWGVAPDSGRWDWAALRASVQTYGARNSLLVAPMPTASTSQILGNNECFEPFTSNIYVRRTLAGEFVVINKHLVRDLRSRGLWSSELKNTLIAARGSVQGLDIPPELKALYKTTWELKGRDLIDMAADRGAFIDQSQSFNVHMEDVTLAKLTSHHFYAWKKKLKTGMYYLRTKAAADAIQFTVAPARPTALLQDTPPAKPAPSPAASPPAKLAPSPPASTPAQAASPPLVCTRECLSCGS